MPSYEHKTLIDRISQLDELPEAATEYATWTKAGGHLTLLRDNAEEDELIIYGSGEYTFIDAVVASEDSLSYLNNNDLLHWSSYLFSSSASYVWGGGRDDVWIERTGCDWGSKKVEDERRLVFARDFEGWKGKDRSYYDILQEYLHLTEIHWRPEEHAYCRFDKRGDLEHVVSVTSREDGRGVTLVSFTRKLLEEYLAASNSVLVRMFDFTLLRRGTFSHWPDGPENVFNESNTFFYRQKVDPGKAAYTRGGQIIRPSRPKRNIFLSMKGSQCGHDEGQYVEFVAYDFRNKRIANISTDLAATTNYFQAQDNSLPFELSPAFFRPEVLLKYTGDHDKYTVRERDIYCRNAWRLRNYDVNEAGQVHAYICDLRNLPYQEQLYWSSFNEKPKAPISKRAITHDFEGKWIEIAGPHQEVLSIMKQWAESGLTWWKLREEALLERVNTPHTPSREEWAGAFMDLSKLIIEGFQVKAIRTRLEEMDIAFCKEDKSIALIEIFLIRHHALDDGQRLNGLRTVQLIRSRMSAHSSGSKAVECANNALQEHGTYSAHFESVCKTLTNELMLIERTFS